MALFRYFVSYQFKISSFLHPGLGLGSGVVELSEPIHTQEDIDAVVSAIASKLNSVRPTDVVLICINLIFSDENSVVEKTKNSFFYKKAEK